MWLSFVLCFLVCSTVLYVPGFIFLQGFGFNKVMSVAAAPLVVVAIIASLSILFNYVSVLCRALFMLIVVIAVSFLPLVCRRLGRWGVLERPSTSKDWLLLAGYIAFGILVTVYLFVLPLDGADSFYCQADNITHINRVRYFMDSGVWSSIGASTGSAAELTDTSYFYPSAWHALAALTALLAEADPTVAINAVNAVISGVVYPTGMFVFIKKLFPENQNAVGFGALATFAITCFPWGFLIKGPYVANLLGYALIPAVLAFVQFFGDKLLLNQRDDLVCGMNLSGLSNKKKQVKRDMALKTRAEVTNSPLVIGVCAGAVACVSIVSLGLSHPNALFTVYVFLVAYLAHCMMVRWFEHKYFALCAVACVGIALWFGMLQLPFLESVVHYPNMAVFSSTLSQSVVDTVAFSFIEGQPPQMLAVAVCCVGFVSAFRERRFWFAFPAVYMLVAFCISRFLSSYARIALCGFWYNDPWRLGSAAVIFLVPFMGLGLSVIARWLEQLLTFLLSRLRRKGLNQKHLRKLKAEKLEDFSRMVAIVITVLIFSICNFFPSLSLGFEVADAAEGEKIETPFGFVRDQITNEYDTSCEQVYSQEERQFVKRVLNEIPRGALVINLPDDGSVFAYGVDGINTLYRYLGVNDLTYEANIVREHLNQFETNLSVQVAAAHLGVEYILLLDQGVSYEDGVWLKKTTENGLRQFDGIRLVTDETLGFNLVLAEGDMRLYQIQEK